MSIKIGMDIGDNGKVAFHGPDGPIVLPRLKPRGYGLGPRNQAEKFAERFRQIIAMGDIVAESATVGSSGVEPALIRAEVEASPHKLYDISGHAVKNYRKDYDILTPDKKSEADAQAAWIIYEISQQSSTTPEGVVIPHCRIVEHNFDAIHHPDNKYKSVRPWDKRNYQGDQVDQWMSNLPPFTSLTTELKRLLGNGNGEYSRPTALPLAMAFEEPEATSRNKYVDYILGASEKRHGSFYSRKVIEIMQDEAKRLADTTHMDEVPREVRKEAWRTVRRELRHLYSLAKSTHNPA